MFCELPTAYCKLPTYLDFKFSNNSRYFIFYSNIDSKTKIGTFNLVDLDNPAKKSTYTKMKLKWRIKLF